MRSIFKLSTFIWKKRLNDEKSRLPYTVQLSNNVLLEVKEYSSVRVNSIFQYRPCIWARTYSGKFWEMVLIWQKIHACAAYALNVMSFILVRSQILVNTHTEAIPIIFGNLIQRPRPNEFDHLLLCDIINKGRDNSIITVDDYPICG